MHLQHIKELIMGLIVDGKWVDQWYDTKKSGGKFERQASRLPNKFQTPPIANLNPKRDVTIYMCR